MSLLFALKSNKGVFCLVLAVVVFLKINLLDFSEYLENKSEIVLGDEIVYFVNVNSPRLLVVDAALSFLFGDEGAYKAELIADLERLVE